jgi:hypothetical protein
VSLVFQARHLQRNQIGSTELRPHLRLYGFGPSLVCRYATSGNQECALEGQLFTVQIAERPDW